MFNRYFIVGIAGAVGAVMRYGVTYSLPVMNNGFPFPTFIINMIGSFFLTFCTFYLFERMEWSETFKTAITVGLIGAFTTFSAFSLEMVALIHSKNYLIALTYIIVSVFGGLAMAYLGYACRKFLGDRA